MANRDSRNIYSRGKRDQHPTGNPAYHSSRSGNKHFRFNIINVALIAVVVIAGLIIGISLSGGKKPAPNAAGLNTDAAVSPTDSLSAKDSSSAEATKTPAANQTDVGAASASPAATQPADTASQGFFTTGDVQVDDNTYKSKDLSVKITNVNKDGINYYIADCRMQDGNKLFTALASDKYAMHTAEASSDMALRKGAVIAVNGDYYGFRNEGIVIRNGQLYRKTPYFDVAAIYNDGTMKTFDKSGTTADKLMADGAIQAFGFGPMLLGSDGKTLANFNEPHVRPANPRSGIGYIEPNHFVLAVVDGRGAGGSKGMTQAEFAKLFESLSCKSAYNFDGGGSATMVFMGKVINHPCDPNGERSVSDIVYFGEKETDQANIDRIQNQ